MNDNIIKMFIGGEEVVSNKEFTINEEMLSASSTILNNCYPASWEESKDYVSNFYYPKDYSKYILGKGNFTYGTEQYSILSVSGETFMQFTTNVEKEWNSLNIYGKSTQATRSGKNLFNKSITPIIASSVQTITELDTGVKISFNGTSLISNTYVYSIYKLVDLTDYVGSVIRMKTNFVSSGNNKPQYILGLCDVNGNNRKTKINTGTSGETISFTVPTLDGTSIYLCVWLYCAYNSPIEKGDYVDFTNLIITVDNSDMTYEPYGVMPSPDFPSEIESVGYENLFNWDNQREITLIKSINRTIHATPVGTLTLEAGTYTLSFPNLQMSNNNYNLGVELVGVISGGTLTNNYRTFTISETKTLKHLYIYLNNNDNDNATAMFSQILLTKGNQSHSYISYGKYGIEVKTTGKNLFSSSLFDKSGTYALYELKDNTSYTLSLKLKEGKSIPSGLYFGFSSSQYSSSNPPTRFDIIANGVFSNKALNKNGTYYQTIIDNSKFKYAFIYPKNINIEEYFDVMLTESSSLLDYEPYKSVSSLFILNQPLRSLPNGVKDIAYIKNNILYVDRKVGTVVLNGSETWYMDKELTNTVRFYTTEILTNKAKLAQPILSNYFITATSVNNINNDDNESAYVLNTTQPVIRINKSIANTLTTFKNWLSIHNTQVDYELAEPYTEKIGEVDTLSTFKGINNVSLDANMETNINLTYLWKNYDILFAGIVKNSGDISLRPTDPKYCSLQILDYKTFLSESDTLDFVISDKTIAQAISMVVDAISGYGFILGTINISQADDVIGAYSTLNKTAYDVFQYLANISGSRWRARFVDNDTMAIDFYDPELLPRANDIDYTQQYWEDNKIVDLTFNYGTRDYRNKQIILSDEVYGGIDYTEVLLSNGYGTSYITQNNIANITSITVNGVKAEVITQSEKDLGVDADFYYTPGKNVVESTTSYSAGTQIIITYTPLVKGRQIVYNDEEVTRIATQTNTTGVISRYENRNDILSSDELENIAETYIKYKGKPEIILKLTTLNNDLFNIGEICYFNSPIADLAQDYMVKSKATNYTSVAGETNIFYTYELTSSFNSEKAINYFDNQRNKTTGNIAEGESITRNIDINNSAMIIWKNATITEISVSVDGDNTLNSVLNSPFIQ